MAVGRQEALTEIAFGRGLGEVYLVVGILLRVVEEDVDEMETATKKKPRLQRDGNPKSGKA